MSTVLFAIPVARTVVPEAHRCFELWKKMGYRTAALVEMETEDPGADSVLRVPEYRGWAWAVNLLARSQWFHWDFCYDWLVTGGHDVHPDPRMRAEDIAIRCEREFNGTFGVMQPAGDAYGALEHDPILACVSPWIGREFVCQVNRGKGPLWEEYHHFYADGELMHVARRLGVLRVWKDLSQYHDHYLRRGEGAPAHLLKGQGLVQQDAATYARRMATGFPGSECANGRSTPSEPAR
jgi:hypothetical protein